MSNITLLTHTYVTIPRGTEIVFNNPDWDGDDISTQFNIKARTNKDMLVSLTDGIDVEVIAPVNDFSEKVQKAREYAINAHGDQKYGDDEPYSIHLDAVHSLVKEYGHLLASTKNFLNMLEISAYLHDVLEDTSVSISEIEQLFGSKVTETVYNVTDETGDNRKQRKVKTWAKIRSSESSIFIKLADRIANWGQAVEKNLSLASMYDKEWPLFEAALYDPNGLFEPMWERLRNIANRNISKK